MISLELQERIHLFLSAVDSSDLKGSRDTLSDAHRVLGGSLAIYEDEVGKRIAEERALEAVALLLGYLGVRAHRSEAHRLEMETPPRRGSLRDTLHDETSAWLKTIEAAVKAEVSPEKVREFLLDKVKDGAFETSIGADALATSLVSMETRSKVKRPGQTLIWVLEALRNVHKLEVSQYPREDSDDLISISWKKSETSLLVEHL